MQDQTTNNWWLNVDNTDIGYFPAALFPNLPSAEQVGWGGRTTTTPGTPNPPMGSGVFPDMNLHQSCYFKWISYKNVTGKFHDTEEFMAKSFTDSPDCYGVQWYGHEKNVGTVLEFGGPGGQCNN